MKEGFDERRLIVDYDVESLTQRPILLYASSGGESLLACNFIKKTAKKGQACYCFAWTKEGVNTFKNFAENQKDVDIRVFYTPFDKPSIIYKALKTINPEYCYIVETEIWFGLLKALHRLEIPFTFINARMTEKTYNFLSKFHFILKKYPPTEVHASGQADLERFSRLFLLPSRGSNLSIQENLKFANVRVLLNEVKNKEIPKLSVPVVLFASIRAEEEKQIISCIKGIFTEFKDICIIVCPKHVNHADTWVEHLRSDGFDDTFCQVSASEVTVDNISEEINAGKRVFVWDTFGDLGKLYGRADIVFVGGSLAPLGGQNFLEPLAHGIIPYVGQHLDNFKWVFDKEPNLIKIGLLKQIYNKNDLLLNLKTDIRDFDMKTSVEVKRGNQELFANWLQ